MRKTPRAVHGCPATRFFVEKSGIRSERPELTCFNLYPLARGSASWSGLVRVEGLRVWGSGFSVLGLLAARLFRFSRCYKVHDCRVRFMSLVFQGLRFGVSRLKVAGLSAQGKCFGRRHGRS